MKKRRPSLPVATTTTKRQLHTQSIQGDPLLQGSIEMLRTGPLPIPHEMREYESIVPGAAERLIRQVEIEGEHRRTLEKHDQVLSFTLTALSNLVAASLVILAGYYGIRMIDAGKDVQGYVLLLTPLATVITAMIVKKKSDK
jgi:uncharacterized membrane protein